MKCYGFQLIFLWQCFVRLFNRGRSAFVRFFQSACSRFIRHKKLVACSLFFLSLLSCLLALGIDKVSAQSPSPTPTYELLFQTPTPRPTDDLSCSGQPRGYGTVTPDALWEMQCYNCITKTPVYTWPTETPTRTPTGTWVPTVTNTPTVTPSPVPTQQNILSCNTAMDGICEVIDYQTLRFHFQGSRPGFGGLGNGSFKRPQGTDLYFTYIGQVQTNHTDSNQYHCRGYDLNVKGWFSAFTRYFQNLRHRTGTCGAWMEVFEFHTTVHPMSTLNDPSDSAIYVYAETQYPNWGTAGDENIYISSAYDYYIFVSARNWTESQAWVNVNQPTPTPTPSGYCSAVKPSSESMQIDQVFKLPNIRIGWARCLQIGGYDVPLGWINDIGQFFGSNWNIPETWTAPGFEACFKPVYFGSITIFGLEINLEFIAAVMAGVVLLRLITRS